MLFAQIEYVTFVYALSNPKVVRFCVLGCVFVAGEAGEVELFFRNSKPFFTCEELKAPCYGFLFEVISERPVAQHLKECAVGRIADFVDVSCADAFLYIGQAFAGGVLLAHEIGYERVHSGCCEQNRRVIFGDQRCAGYDSMSMFFKKFEI